MLISDVATRVKRQFGDEVGAQITDADLIRWVNDAQKEIALQNKLLQTIATQSTVVGQSDYALPADILSLRGVRYDKLRLTRSTMDDIDELVEDASLDRGTPNWYFTRGTTLTLWPVPDAIRTLTVYYVATPTALTAVGNTIALPAQFDNRIVEYCIDQAAELDDNLEHYTLKMQQFQTGIDQHKESGEQVEQDDQYPFITYQLDEYL